MEYRQEEKKPAELDECKAKCEEYLNGWKRAKADLANYKKDEFERTQELVGYAKENFLENLLPLLDNLDIAEAKLPPESKEDANVKGLLMVKTQLEDFLRTHGVEAFGARGRKFDPAVHEIILAVESKETEPGTVLEEIERGYTINGRLLRPAKVKVAK